MNTNIADFDLEANDFLRDATVIWCGVAYINDINEWRIYHVNTDEQIDYPSNSKRVSMEEFLVLLTEYKPSAYNGIGYDFPLLKKLHGFTYEINPNKIVDPLIMSRLSYPDRDGHAIADWGKRFKMYKGDHNDFSKFSNDQLQYCIQDVRILTRARKFLEEEMSDWDWSASLQLEYAMQALQVKQETHGVLFNQQAARELVNTIHKELEEIEQTVIPQIPKKLVDLGEVRKPFLKSGCYSAITIRFLESCKEGKTVL